MNEPTIAQLEAREQAYEECWIARYAYHQDNTDENLKRLAKAKAKMQTAYGGMTQGYIDAWQKIMRETD